MLKRVETLLLIPCWWDGNAESLISTIKFFRPDLLEQMNDDSSPISMNPPIDFFERLMVGSIPNVGELMLASLPDSSEFVVTISESNSWWVGEKYDGVRMCWNPMEKKLYTRSGLPLQLLQSFVDSFSNSFLDGEIWFGRGVFLEAYKVVQSLFLEVAWAFMRIIGFDDPTPKRNGDKYEQRHERIISQTPIDHPFVVIPSRFKCDSKRKVVSAVEGVIEEGGEGVILQKPKSTYEHGRSQSLAKIKASRGDNEAIVVCTKEDSVELQTPYGVLFTVLQKDFHLPQALKKGDVVSFAYDTYSRRAAPVNPKIYRIRADVVWADVVREAMRDSSVHSLNRLSSKVMGHTENSKGHWTANQYSNVRSLLIKFVQSKGLDPLLPGTWYSISRRSVEESADARVALGIFRGGFVKTLMRLFPKIGLDESKFNLKGNYWEKTHNRRKFFVQFARKLGFDPLCAADWYNMNLYKATLLQEQGANAVLTYYDDRLVNALVHLFPEIKFNSSQFNTSFQRYYENEENRRSFFVEFAKSKSFDPLNAEDWYSVSIREIKTLKGARSLLLHYRSLPNALRHIFPNIGLQKFKFSNSAYYETSGSSNKLLLKHRKLASLTKQTELARLKGRSFFDAFAKTQSFDPLMATNWYSVSPLQIRDSPGYKRTMKRYNGSWRKALVDLYSELRLQIDQFNQYPGGYWLDMGNRRAFLESMAAERSLDPLLPSTWSTITYKDVSNRRGGTSLLYYYNGNFTKAVMDIFQDLKDQ